jgi:hypothetical protein
MFAKVVPYTTQTKFKVSTDTHLVDEKQLSDETFTEWVELDKFLFVEYVE